MNSSSQDQGLDISKRIIQQTIVNKENIIDEINNWVSESHLQTNVLLANEIKIIKQNVIKLQTLLKQMVHQAIQQIEKIFLNQELQEQFQFLVENFQFEKEITQMQLNLPQNQDSSQTFISIFEENIQKLKLFQNTVLNPCSIANLVQKFQVIKVERMPIINQFDDKNNQFLLDRRIQFTEENIQSPKNVLEQISETQSSQYTTQENDGNLKLFGSANKTNSIIEVQNAPEQEWNIFTGFLSLFYQQQEQKIEVKNKENEMSIINDEQKEEQKQDENNNDDQIFQLKAKQTSKRALWSVKSSRQIQNQDNQLLDSQKFKNLPQFLDSDNENEQITEFQK